MNELIIIFLILILILGYVIVFNKTNTYENFTNYKVKIVTPQFVYHALKSKEKIYLVNVLSDKMKYKITLNGKNKNKSMSKKQFETILKNNGNKIPDDVKSVILYCASWSCHGAKNYFKELINKGVHTSKVVDYIGAIHEWASYAKINPEVFTFHSTKKNKNLLNSEQIDEIIKNTAHGYFVDNVLQDKYLKKISEKGKIFIDNL